MDKLEKYIADNRESLDTKVPGDLVWKRIEDQLITAPKANRFAWIWKAAAVVLLGISSLLLYQKLQLQEQVDLAHDSTNENTMTLDTGFEEAEFYYTSVIQEKRQEIANFQVDDPQLKAEFNSDLDELDLLYVELKEELFETSNEKVMEALFENLKLRIDILNRQLEILEKIKNYQNEDAPKIPTT